MRLKYLSLALFLMTLACTASINESVYVNDGETKNSNITTVNGAIIIGKNCTVNGDSRAVNGRITVGENSVVEGLQTVNGRINIAANVRVKDGISMVNGSVVCDTDVVIDKDITTINGDIELSRTTVRRDLETMNGDITLNDGSIIERNIIIKGKSKGDSGKRRIDIYINDNSEVHGDINVEDDDISVKVYLVSTAKISGDVINAEIVYQ